MRHDDRVKTELEFPETLQEAIKYFADEQRAFDYMKLIRWPDGIVRCPRCESDKVSFISTRKLWTCKTCKTKKQFTLRVGTIFEDSPIKYDKWICAIWLIANAKNGISSYEIGRALGVCQKTGWFMLQRIRLAMQQGSFKKMRGIVEADESYIGAKARNMHWEKRKDRIKRNTGGWHMSPVQGILQRGDGDQPSQIVVKALSGTKKPELQGNVREYVLKGSTLHTDKHRSYDGLEDDYDRQVVDHAVEYANGTVHTNGLENFWSLLKRTIRGTYVSVEPFHLFRYLDEQAFRFNERKDEDGDRGRFLTAMAGIVGKRLTWAKLTGENEGLPAEA